LTSPNANKPEGISGDYDDVHSRGSSFGQDLSAKGVRDNLLGTNISWFERIGNSFVEAVGHIGDAIFSGIDQLFGGSGKELPPLYKGLTDSVFTAVKPIHSLADRALDKATTAQDKADSLNEDLTGSIDGDMSEAAENYSGLVGQINQEAKKFGQWEVEHQEDLNASFSLALSAQEQINDVNQIQWQTQADYNKQNNEINQSQTEALKLHENQLMLMDAVRPRAWVFYTSTTHDRDPWVSVRVNDRSIGVTSYVEIQALGSWAGRVVASLSFYDQGSGSESAVDQYDWLVTRGSAQHRHIRFDAGAVHMGIKNVAVTIYPYWGNEKREFLLKPFEDDSTKSGYGFRETEAYTNDLEGNPIVWGYAGDILFSDLTVRADQDVWVLEDDDQWVFLNGYGGDTIPPGYSIRADSLDLVTFTEA